MSLIGQPESYSDILKRIFAATFVVSFICTFSLAYYSPSVARFLNKWDAEGEFGGLDGVKALYVFVPIGIAVLARIFRLHNKISDIFGIRRDFDVNQIILPLANRVGVQISYDSGRAYRKPLMSGTFYRFASFFEPKIDVQLVRAAADQWAWYWCTMEPIPIIIVTASIHAAIGAWRAGYWFAVAAFIFWWLSEMQKPFIEKRARKQIDEILSDSTREAEIAKVFRGV